MGDGTLTPMAEQRDNGHETELAAEDLEIYMRVVRHAFSSTDDTEVLLVVDLAVSGNSPYESLQVWFDALSD